MEDIFHSGYSFIANWNAPLGQTGHLLLIGYANKQSKRKYLSGYLSCWLIIGMDLVPIHLTEKSASWGNDMPLLRKWMGRPLSLSNKSNEQVYNPS